MRHARRPVLALMLTLAACGTDSPDDELAADEEALSLRGLCSGQGTETFDGIDGTYDRVGWKRTDEIERLLVTAATPLPTPRKARYQRTITRSCSAPGCREESGELSLLPDNAAFSTSFGFYPTAAGAAANPSELYFVLGASRKNGTVDEICLARVVTATDVRRPFRLKRVP